NDVVHVLAAAPPDVHGGSHRDRLLTAPHVDAADDLALTVQLPLDAELQGARQLHRVQHLEERRVVRRRQGRAGLRRNGARATPSRSGVVPLLREHPYPQSPPAYTSRSVSSGGGYGLPSACRAA